VDLAGEAGFGIIEVLVSSIMVVLISLALFTAIDAAGRTADNNKSRSVASSLAQDDQERLRSIAITALARSATTRTVTVDGEAYTVDSTGEYLPGSAGSDNCASNDEAPKYVKITSTVSWQNMRGAKPVVANSLRATPSGTIGDFGSLAVDINNRSGNGQADIAVTITPDAEAAAAGGVTTTANTNAKGCVIFGYIRSGRYTITASKTGHVLAANPNLTAINEQAVVAADSIASKSYTYDLAGAVRVAYKTTTVAGGAVEGNANGAGFTIANALLGTPAVKTFTHTSGIASPNPGALVNFPFTTNYEVWAGTCLGAKPNGNTTVAPIAPAQTLAVPAGAQSTVTSVREPKLTFTIKYFTTSAQTTTANVSGGLVKLTPTDSTCTAAQSANTNSSGVVSFNAPYGPYTLCYQNKASSPTSKLTAAVTNDTANGKATTPATLPYRTGTAAVVAGC
jgi:Tfp pilus assembly protein PilV